MSGQNATIYTIVDTAIGQISIVRSDKGLYRISIHASRKSAAESIAQRFPQSIESSDDFKDLPQRLQRYARGECIKFNDKLDFDNATPFQRAVWEATRSIPYGETRTYKWVAQSIGNPKAIRAVGQALKRNPLPIIVPCHRVIGSDSSLTGFSAGLDLKERLLKLEAGQGLKKTR